jgi:hypothetical protein
MMAKSSLEEQPVYSKLYHGAPECMYILRITYQGMGIKVCTQSSLKETSGIFQVVLWNSKVYLLRITYQGMEIKLSNQVKVYKICCNLEANNSH